MIAKDHAKALLEEHVPKLERHVAARPDDEERAVILGEMKDVLAKINANDEGWRQAFQDHEQARMLLFARRVVIKVRFDGTAEDARRKGYDHRLDMDRDEVVYGERDRDDTRGGYEDVPAPTLDRWAVNWLRHQRSDYDDLQSQCGRVGAHEARRVIGDRVLDVIAERWPDLRGACGNARMRIGTEPDYFAAMDDLRDPPPDGKAPE